MTKEQLIQIAEVSFPDTVKQFIDFKNAEMHVMGNVYRLYDRFCEFRFMLPKEFYFSIDIEENNFVQIQVHRRKFNHYAAIKEMEKLGLIK